MTGIEPGEVDQSVCRYPLFDLLPIRGHFLIVPDFSRRFLLPPTSPCRNSRRGRRHDDAVGIFAGALNLDADDAARFARELRIGLARCRRFEVFQNHLCAHGFYPGAHAFATFQERTSNLRIGSIYFI